MRPLRWILAGLALYLGALLATLPAPWAWWALERWLPERTAAVLPRLHGLAGSLWEGEARLALWRGWRLEGLRWELHPAALLAGRAEARLALEAPARGAGVLAWSPGAWQARELRLELDPEGLAALLARAPGGRLLALDGRVVAEVARLRLAAGDGRWRAEEAQGTLVWTGAGLRRPVAVALGAFRARLEAEEGALLLRFRDAGGPLEAQGTLRLDLPRRRYRLEAALALRERSRTDLAQALRLLGRPGPDGRLRLRQEGPAPFLP